MIFDLIFKIIYEKVSNSMLSNDKLIFGLKLVQIKMNREDIF